MSRFDELLKSAKGRPAEEPRPEPQTSAPTPPAPPGAAAARKPGRPKGKKSDPGYEQVTAYVPTATYGRVRSVLWNHHGRKEFSTLVAELLADWLESQPSE